jgi:hypothetical protein
MLPIQVLESGAFLGLATVVAPYANVRYGTPILEARLLLQNGNENRIEVKMGAMEVLALPVGQSGRLFLQPLHNVELGLNLGSKRANGIPVTGTVLGLVFDGRGRPLIHPTDDGLRREIIKKWIWTLGD